MTPSDDNGNGHNGNGDRELTPEALEGLHRLARSRSKSGRGRLAKLGAIRTLERLSREHRSTLPMPAGWHPGPSEFEALDVSDSAERRENWWQALHG